MEAVILAGGLGTRLRAVIPDLPKAMAPVAGRPFLEILLRSLAGKGVTRAILSLGYRAGVITSHFGSRFEGVDLVYEIEDRPLGTGGALRAAMQRCLDPAVLVVNGDTFLDLDARAAMTRWQAAGHPIIVAKEMSDTARYGRLLFDGGYVVGFEEKGKSGPGSINTGHYVLPAKLFEGHVLPAVFSFEVDFLAIRVADTLFEALPTLGGFIDIGVPSDYERAQVMFAELS